MGVYKSPMFGTGIFGTGGNDMVAGGSGNQEDKFYERKRKGKRKNGGFAVQPRA